MMKELTGTEAHTMFEQLTTGLNGIRWGKLALTQDVIVALLELREKPTGNTQVWVVSKDVGARLSIKYLDKPTPEFTALSDVFDPFSKAACSIGVLYGMEVLVGDVLPEGLIVLADVEDGKVLSHVASWIQVSQ